MTHKRNKTIDASLLLTTRFNRVKFVSFDVKKKYNDSLLQQCVIQEWEFKFQEGRITYHSTILNWHRWNDFDEQPELNVLALVREFYANFND